MSPFFKFQKCSRLKRSTARLKKEPKLKKCKNSMFLKVFLILILAGSVFLYLMQINSLATKGFKIQEFEKKVSDLSEGNKKLSVEAVRLRSMAELNEKVHNLDMVPVSEFSYLEATSTGVAKR